MVTLLLIAINAAVYLAVQPHGDALSENEFSYKHAAIPCEIREQEPLDRAEYFADTCAAEDSGVEFFPHKDVWLSILYSMFLHGSLLHLAGNMLFLWIFGNNVEDYLGKIGFVIFYLFAGLVATLAHVLADPSSVIPVVGASGAIAGVMGMYLVLWPHARIWSFVPFFWFALLPIPAGIMLLLWFGMQFLTGDDSGVAWVAHVGGFVAGAGIGLLLRQFKKPWVQPGFEQLT